MCGGKQDFFSCGGEGVGGKCNDKSISMGSIF